MRSFNIKPTLELLRYIGLYPIPAQLSFSNLLKGWVLVLLFIQFVLWNFWMSLILWLARFVFAESRIITIKDFISQLFWTSLIYLINKRKIKIVISGIDNKKREVQEQLNNAIIISNHRSLFDFLLVNYLKTMVEKSLNINISLSFFNWKTLWQVPGATLFYQMFKNDENWEMNKLELDQTICSKLKTNKNNWICLFPETNIYNDDIKLIQNQQAEKYYLPKYNDLLYPRFNNFNNIIECTQKNPNSPIKNLLDLTILYYNPVRNTFTSPTIFEILTLKQPVLIIHVDFKIRPIYKLPTKQRRLEKWLESDWIEKDKIIEAIQKELKINK